MDFTTVKKNLEARGFTVSTFATAKEAADYLNAQIDHSSVSFGGSMTLSQMGLFESLGAHTHTTRCTAIGTCRRGWTRARC